MRVDLHTCAQAFETLQEEWHDLLARSSYDTLFLRPAWLAAWWQVFGSEGTLRVLTVREAGGRLIGIAPLFLASLVAEGAERLPNLSYERPAPDPRGSAHQTLLLVGGTEVSDYSDLIADRTAVAPVYQAILGTLREIGGWEWLDLHNLPGESPTPTVLGELARGAGLTVALGREDVCPYITLPSSWEGYLGSLGKKDRHELRRKMRNMEQVGAVQCVEANDPATLDGDLAAFIALHEASTPDKADFMRDPRMRRFFDLVARTALANGWLDLSFLTVNGQRAASMFCFRYQGTTMVYNSGFDPQAWPQLSPGIVLLGRRIRQAIEAGHHEFDFLQGDERYKYDLGARERPVWRLLVRRA